MLEYFSYKLYYNRTTITDRTTHSSTQDTVILDKSIKETNLIDVAIPNSRNFHGTITEKLQKYTDLKEELQESGNCKMAYIIPIVIFTKGIIQNKLYESMKLLNLCPCLYNLMQKAVTLNTCHTVTKFLAEQWIRCAWSVMLYTFGNKVNCCEVGNVYQDDSDTLNKGKMLPYSEHETSF